MKKFKKIVFLFVIISCQILSSFSTSDETKERSWIKFLRKFEKKYENYEEFSKRREIFKENMNLIDKLNRKYEKEKINFTCDWNEYADMTSDEFQSQFAGFKPQVNFKSLQAKPLKDVATLIATILPNSVDWRPTAVTSVKNQGECGNCWAFASVAALETQYARKFNQLISLSTQNLVDCVKTINTEGCSGGIMPDAFQYVKDNGIMAESAYSYEARDDGQCRYDSSEKVGNCSGYAFIPSGSESKLQEAVANIGAIAVGIDAHPVSLQFYTSGIYSDSTCNAQNLNHAVTVVGYGSDGPFKDYWIIKNSWGSGWGEKGYFRLARNRNNKCGVASYACYPIVK